MSAPGMQEALLPGAEVPTGAETPPEAHSASSDPTDAELRSREAAGYRTRLRAAEEQLEQRDQVISGLRDELDRLHRAEAERLATREGMAVPADLWTLHQLADVRDEDGRLDAERVVAIVRAVLADRPTWRRELPDLGSGARGSGSPREVGLADLLGKRR